MEEEIIKTFYDKILPSVRRDAPTYVGDWAYHVNFDSNNDDRDIFNSNLVINIKDNKRFEDALIEYTKSMIDHLVSNSKLHEYDNVYFEGDISHIIESALLNVWFNATEEDFKDPIKYLRCRTNFLIDDFSNGNLDKKYISNNIGKLFLNSKTNSRKKNGNDMAAYMTQPEHSDIKYYASAFSNTSV